MWPEGLLEMWMESYCGKEATGGNGMKEYEVYRECGYLDLVAVIKARTYEEAQEEAHRLGYGKEFRIEEVDNG